MLEDGVSERASPGDEIADKVEDGEPQETFGCPADKRNELDASHVGGSGDSVNNSSCESIPCPTVSQNVLII